MIGYYFLLKILLHLVLLGEAVVEEFVGFCGGLISMYVSSPSADFFAAGCLAMMVVHFVMIVKPSVAATLVKVRV